MKWEKLRESYDKKDVLSWMRTFPDQCIEAVYYGKKFKPKKRRIKKIVGCGMGGSGVGSKIIKNLLKDELNVPFDVFHSYHVPEYVDSKTLVLITSFSGNTEETLNCFKEAKKRKAYIVSITTNGKLKKMAKNCIVIPASAPVPRMGLAYTCLPQLMVLEKLGLIKKKSDELNEAVFLLKKSQARLEEKAKELALKFRGKLPVIYAPEELEAVAYRFRTDLNETSKQFALHHTFPEHNHNEINAMLGLRRGNCEFLFLRHGNEHSRVSRRLQFVKKLFRKNFNVTEVELEGKSLLATTFYAVQLAQLTSYYLALLNRMDPEPVPLIANLKKELKK